MYFNPHEYQQQAIKWLIDHPSSALFLDMGLGKTVITLTALMYLRQMQEYKKVLVVAPLRVARDSWKDEAQKWDHLKSVQVIPIVGNQEERLKALNTDTSACLCPVYTIGRENVPWLVQTLRWQWDFDCIVLDELSSFKNYKAKRFKALMSVRRRVRRWIGLTGTPAVNGLEDLWAEMLMIDGGERLGKSISNFRMLYELPEKMSGQIVYSYKTKRGAEDVVANKVSDIVMSMKAIDHLKMPALVSQIMYAEMTPKERTVYKELKKEYTTEIDGAEITAFSAGALSGKLLQLANGAAYAEAHGKQERNAQPYVCFHQRKLDILTDLIEEAQGQPMLVAYWYKFDLGLIRKTLDALKVRYASLDSAESIQAWNRGELSVGLIHPASAGHGLNLQSGGHHIVWYGLTWSLELYQQTNARLYRQGQRSETVLIQHIVTRGTIDEQVIKALTDKDVRQERIIAAVKKELCTK